MLKAARIRDSCTVVLFGEIVIPFLFVFCLSHSPADISLANQQDRRHVQESSRDVSILCSPIARIRVILRQWHVTPAQTHVPLINLLTCLLWFIGHEHINTARR